MPLKERNSFRLQNLVNVTLSIEVALHKNEICFPSAHNATPYHNTPTSKSVPLNGTIINKTFPSSSKNSNSTVMMTKVKPRLIRELNPSPLLSLQTEMPLCPLQTGNPMTCCKHLSHIGPPWPNGCRACLRRCNTVCLLIPYCRRNTVCLLIPYCLAELVAVRKRRRRCVSVMHLFVRGFVTLGLPGLRRSATPPVCWKRWCNRIIVFL